MHHTTRDDMIRYPNPRTRSPHDTLDPWYPFRGILETPDQLRKRADRIEKLDAAHKLREAKEKKAETDRMVKELEEQGYRVHHPGWAPD